MKIERSESNFKSEANKRKMLMKEHTESPPVIIVKHSKKSVKEASSSFLSLISSANSGEAEVSQPYLPFPSTSASSSSSKPHPHSHSSKSSHSKPRSSTTTLSPSSTAGPTASSLSSSSSSSSISSSSSASQNTSVFKQFLHCRQPLTQTHKKHSGHTLKPISTAHTCSTLSQNASEIKRQKKKPEAIAYSSSSFSSSSSSSSVLQEIQCSLHFILPSFFHHWISCAEMCGQRSTMEDSVLLLPVDGCDIEKLVCDGEVGVLARILKYPQELMFTEKGMKALEDREDEIWARRMREKERKKKERMERKRKEEGCEGRNGGRNNFKDDTAIEKCICSQLIMFKRTRIRLFCTNSDRMFAREVRASKKQEQQIQRMLTIEGEMWWTTEEREAQRKEGSRTDRKRSQCAG
ncbi:uncharacterized protein MONOS_11805 [Monocercomonoides exilis]|uniref:uncharacterized protein n=1 Tax=Monocercomonoides exilis TaxID=2049356 RepID=UPI003559B2AB|nr:hypothetical protein MONOS_11805 [Monocercomonoides exilis]|eukprot:MONOS_11805.1-p1 / transcript=MONOS_11805.1 / gene=MONOS_11805 / organism=Monocercomonoides_exilis_PA203 / gene_product=unspecified product / transcript_product=unspecified product / location=Mono_scaffold00613:27413-29071(+) / protein_length=407 / sequence_SO=supercontig / SO=protein_coding / is_pseudo=false